MTNRCGRRNPVPESYNIYANRAVNRNDNNFRSNYRLNDFDIHNTHHSFNNMPFGSTLQSFVVTEVSIDPQIPLDDDPPTYEMALLCPTVQLIDKKDVSDYNPNK